MVSKYILLHFIYTLDQRTVTDRLLLTYSVSPSMYDSRVPDLYVTKSAAQNSVATKQKALLWYTGPNIVYVIREALVVSDYLLHHIKLLQHYSNSSFITTVTVSFKTMLLL